MSPSELVLLPTPFSCSSLSRNCLKFTVTFFCSRKKTGFIFISRDRLSPLCFLSFALFNLLDFLQFPVGKNVLRTTHHSHSAWLFNNMLLLLFSCTRPETNSASAQSDAMVFPREFHVSGGSLVTNFALSQLFRFVLNLL